MEEGGLKIRSFHSTCKIQIQINYAIKYEKQDFKIMKNTEKRPYNFKLGKAFVNTFIYIVEEKMDHFVHIKVKDSINKIKR